MESTSNRSASPYVELGLPLAAVLSFVGSAFAGTYDGILYRGLWVALAVVGIAALVFAFPNAWKYGVWLLGAYLCALVGISFFVLKRLEGLHFMLIGLAFILGSVSLGWSLVQEIRYLRDLVKDNTLGRRYVPIGNWFILVVLFVVFSNLSIYSWTNWVDPSRGWTPVPYLFFEIALAVLTVVILWFPELAIEWDKLKEDSPTIAALKRELKAAEGVVTIVKRAKKKPAVSVMQFSSCPLCSAKLSIHKRKCPSCGNEESVGWCPKHETFIVSCVSCGKPTPYGMRACKSCGTPMGPRLACVKCKNEASIKEWTRVETHARASIAQASSPGVSKELSKPVHDGNVNATPNVQPKRERKENAKQ